MVDDVSVLAVSHHRQLELLGCSKYSLQRFILIHQHIARAGTHKELDARYAMHIEQGKAVHIVVSGTIEETIVHMTLLGC